MDYACQTQLKKSPTENQTPVKVLRMCVFFVLFLKEVQGP